MSNLEGGGGGPSSSSSSSSRSRRKEKKTWRKWRKDRRWKRSVVGKRSDRVRFESRLLGEEEGRKKDGEQGEWIHPSVTLWQTARESQCEASLFSSLCSSFCRTARSPIPLPLSLSLSSRPSLSACPSDRLFVCLLSLSSPASPDASLASGIHLLSCPVPCPPPPLLLLFPPSFSLPLPPSHSAPFLYLILPFNSKWIEIVIEICNLRESSVY